MKGTADATSGNTKHHELLERAKQGDQAAFVELITEYEYIIRSIIRTFIRRIQGYEEDDIVNEVIISVYKIILTFRGDVPAFKYFLRRTTKGLCLNLLHRRENEQEEIQEEADETTPKPDETYLAEKIRECVQKSIGLLSPKYRKIIELVDIQKLAYKEAANVLRIPIGTVQSRTGRARERLKQLFEELRCKELL